MAGNLSSKGMTRIDIDPVGYVETSYSDREISESWPRGVEGKIVIYPDYVEGVKGLEEFSHIIVLAWLHKVSKAERSVLKVRFRRFAKLGVRLEDLPEVGVFCSDSPHRPNPLAISILKLDKIDGNRLYVSGLDLYNGTPILDIRAYTPMYSLKHYKTPEWYQRLLEKAGMKR